MGTSRKIAVITGTRAEYGILKPVLDGIQNDDELELVLIVTGTHLSGDFGHTVDEIKNDGFDISAQIDVLHSEDSGAAMAKSIGELVTGLAGAFEKSCPDIVFLLGDRGEMLAGAVAASYMNIPITHSHGGELSGNVDEQVRHAITKLAHIHFPATQKSADRIIKMGEEDWRVNVTGAPGLDTILNIKLPEERALSEKYGVDFSAPLVLIVQHPVVQEMEGAEEQMGMTLEVIKGLGLQTILVYPNSDAGGRRMIEAIKEYEGLPFFKTFKSLPHRDYLGFMKYASVMVGNSSSGIIEAPSFGLPVVNIGTRQEGRERWVNVIDVDYDPRQIRDAINKALYDHDFISQVKGYGNPYGTGNASEKIVKVLKELNIDNQLLNKRMAY